MKSLSLILALAVGTVLALGSPAWSDKKKDGKMSCARPDMGGCATENVIDTEAKGKKDEKKKDRQKNCARPDIGC
jgi:hypothetical protein